MGYFLCFSIGGSIGFLGGWLGYRRFGAKGEEILTEVKKL
jgi:hypothetical protein